MTSSSKFGEVTWLSSHFKSFCIYVPAFYCVLFKILTWNLQARILMSILIILQNFLRLLSLEVAFLKICDLQTIQVKSNFSLIPCIHIEFDICWKFHGHGYQRNDAGMDPPRCHEVIKKSRYYDPLSSSRKLLRLSLAYPFNKKHLSIFFN